MKRNKLTAEQTLEESEISARSYLEYILFMLKTDGGYMRTDTVYSEIYNEFAPYMSDADLKPLAKRKTPKWKNMVDWAKALGTKEGKLSTVTFERHRYVVLLDNSVTEIAWLKLAEKQSKTKRKSSFQKRCMKCKTYQSLGNKKCIKCEAPLPVSTKRRIRRIPR